MPEIFRSAAEYQPNTGAYRISSKTLGRELEEDLSIHPDGVKDFGVWDIGDARRGKRSAIDIVIEYGGKRDATEAALWLCERCGVDPATLGWDSAGQRRPVCGWWGRREANGENRVRRPQTKARVNSKPKPRHSNCSGTARNTIVPGAPGWSRS